MVAAYSPLVRAAWIRLRPGPPAAKDESEESGKGHLQNLETSDRFDFDSPEAPTARKERASWRKSLGNTLGGIGIAV